MRMPGYTAGTVIDQPSGPYMPQARGGGYTIGCGCMWDLEKTCMMNPYTGTIYCVRLRKCYCWLVPNRSS